MRTRKLLLFAAALVLGGCGNAGTSSSNGNADQPVQTANTGGGQSSTSSTVVSEADLAVPFYPGSTPKDNGDVKSDGDKEFDATSARETADPAQKVVDFYKDAVTKAGYKVEGNTSTDDSAQLTATKGEDERVTVSYTHSKETNTNTVVVEHWFKKNK